MTADSCATGEALQLPDSSPQPATEAPLEACGAPEGPASQEEQQQQQAEGPLPASPEMPAPPTEAVMEDAEAQPASLLPAEASEAVLLEQQQEAAQAQPEQHEQEADACAGVAPGAAPAVRLQVQLPSDADESGPPSPCAEVSFSPPAQPADEAQQALPEQQQAQQPACPPSPSGLRSSLSPGETRALHAASRRQQAAEWVAALTGCTVPHDSDAAFRASLRDGVTLCRLANVLRPGSVGRIIDYSQECTSPTGEVIRTFENVANFIAAAKELTGDSTCLSAADLEDRGERPAVADCLLALQAWWQAQQAPASGTAPARVWGGSRPTSPRPASPHTACPRAASPTGAGFGATFTPNATPPPPLRQPPSPHGAPASPEFSFTPHAAAAVQQAAGAPRGPGTDGLEYLMRTCNHMLKSTMGMPATPLPPPPRIGSGLPSEIAAGAVGPVLESVLNDLIKEYEKRLLAKDQEFKLSQEAQERMRRDIARLKQEVVHWKEQAAAVKYLPAPQTELSAAEREAYEQQLREKEAAAAAEVARKEAELRAVQDEAAAHVAEADAKLGELVEQVENYRGMQERYLQMAEENRQLYNTVQDLRGNIRVFCRVRPRGRTGDSSNCMVELGDEGQVQVYSQKHNKWHSFKFDKVFPEDSNQDVVYAETQPLIRSVLDGYNVCIFAYGQTGSGKTHTMSGTNISDYTGRGLYYRALDDLFELNCQRGAEVTYTITVQLLEIYNEAIRDLLVSDAEARQQRSLQLVNGKRSGSNVPEAIQVPVSCTEDVLEVMERGARNRAVAETRMNDRSSRSHQVLTIVVDGTNKLSHARTHGCLHLIDLAGSERVGKSGAEGQQLLEAQHINKSLSALGNVMHALASKSGHVPFRDSKLTQLLQDSLSGQAKTMMFMHVAPEANSVSETLSTLNFGKGVTEITLGAAKKNAESGAAWEAKERALKSERDAAAAQRALVAEQQRRAELEAELEVLRAQLARVGSSSCPASDDEGGSMRALRPPTSRQAGVAAAGGLTPRSRLALSATAAAAAPPPAQSAGSGRLTPRSSGGAGSRGLTPRSALSAGGSGSATPRSGSVSQRPPQVSRLNLGGSSGSKLGAVAPAATSGRPTIAKLNLQKLHRSEADENKTPLSARLSPAGSNPNSARRTSPGSSTNWLVDASDCSDLSCSEDDSPMRSLSAAADRSPRGAPGSQHPAAAGEDDADSFQLPMSPPRPLTARTAAAAAAAATKAGTAAARPASVSRLPLNQLKSGSSSALSRLPQAPNSSRIPALKPSPPSAAARSAAHPSGSLTARPSLGRTSKSPPLSSSIPRVPLSARESSADAAARRAALQQKVGSASSLRRSIAAPSSSSMRRSMSGSAAEGGSSSGALNSARGVRSSSASVKRWN